MSIGDGSIKLMRGVPGAWGFAFALAAAIASGIVLYAYETHALEYAGLFMALGVPAFVLVFVPWYVVLRRVTLTVERDGLRLREGLRRSSFVPFGSITRIAARGRHVTLERDGSSPLVYAVGPMMHSHGLDVGRVDQTARAQALVDMLKRARRTRTTT